MSNLIKREDAIEAIATELDNINNIPSKSRKWVFDRLTLTLNKVHSVPSSQSESRYREIALDLLRHYIRAEEGIVKEYNCDAKYASGLIAKSIKKYLKELDAESEFDRITQGFWIFEKYGEEE